MPRRTRMRIGKHLHPIFIDHRPVRHILQPDAQLDDIFRLRATGLQNFSHIGEHLRALRVHPFGDLAGAGILSEDSATDQKRTHAAGIRDRIDVLQAGDFNADTIAHFSSVPSTSFRPGADAMRAAASPGSALFEETYVPIVGALGRLLTAAEQAGLVRAGLDPDDVILALAGLWEIDPRTDWKAKASRLYDLVFTGLRA